MTAFTVRAPEGLKELLWALFLVNVFVAVAGGLVGRRLDSVTMGIVVYLGVSAIASGLILATFAANVLLCRLLEWRDRRRQS